MAEKARPQVGQLLSKMSHDDRVDLLAPAAAARGRSRDAARRRGRPPGHRDALQYGENTVGALMTTDYAWLPGTLTAAEAIDQLRQQAPDRETIYYIYVLDDPPAGPTAASPRGGCWAWSSLRDLILAPRHALIRELMETRTRHPPLRRGRRRRSPSCFARYDFLAAPVVDDQFGLLGIVTHDDVLDVVQQEATEDLQRQAGGRADRGGLPRGQLLSGLEEPGAVAGGAVCRRTVHVHRDGAIRGVDRDSRCAGPVRPAVHLDRRQLRHAGRHARHAGDGPGLRDPTRLAAGTAAGIARWDWPSAGHSLLLPSPAAADPDRHSQRAA